MMHVVLLHGWGMNQGIWQLQKEQLCAQSQHAFITLDLPGFGENPFTGTRFSLKAISEQLVSDIPDNSVLVAWSLSGLVALTIARLYPEKVSKVILVASSPFFTAQQHWAGIQETVLDTFMKQLEHDHYKTIDRFLAIQAMGSEHAKQDIKQIKKLLSHYPKAQPIALAGGLEILKNEDLRTEFSQSVTPISGIFGRLDSLVPAKAVANMKQINPSFHADIMPYASHAPFISHPEEFSNLLLSHIER